MFSRRPVPQHNRGRIPAGAGASSAPSFPISGAIVDIDTFFGDDTTHLSTGGTSNIQQFVNVATSTTWAQATSANQFAFEADSTAGGLNGFPCGHPDGGDNYRATEAGLLTVAQSDQAHTVYLVLSPDTVAANMIHLSWANSASTGGYRGYGMDSSGRLWANGNTAAAAVANTNGTTVLAANRPYVVAFRATGGVTSGWLDGVAETMSGAGAQAVGALPSVNRFTYGRRGRSTDDLGWDGRAAQMLIYNSAHTDEQIAAQCAWLVERWQLTYHRLVTLGDSLYRGFGSVSGEFLSERVPLSSNSGKWQRINGATNGYTTSDAISVFAARITARRRWTGAIDVMDLGIGTNDVTQTNDSAATIYGRITTLINDAQALGYLVVVSTLILRSDARTRLDGTTPANPTILDVNTLILANSAGADAVFDAYNALNVVAGAEANTAPNTYYSDDTHLTDAGYDLLAIGHGAAIDSVA